MKLKTPAGFTADQWEAVTDGLQAHPATVNDYRKVVERFHHFHTDPFSFAAVTAEEAVQYFTYLQEESGLSASTVHRYQATLRSIGTRMENRPDVFPGYKNPFRGILKKELRQRTTYTPERFPDHTDVRKILAVLPDCPRDEQLILYLMILHGFQPKQICLITVRDFRNDSGSLCLDLEQNAQPAADAGGKQTASQSILFLFSEPWVTRLRELIPDIGTNTDHRPFFMTSRHMPYSYHSIHHLVRTVCLKAGLEPGAIKPGQLSLYGIIYASLREHESELPYTELEAGYWQNGLPAAMRQTVQEITSQLGEDFLYMILGIEK